MHRGTLFFGYAPRHKALFRNIPTYLANLFLLFLVIGLAIGFTSYAKQFFSPIQEGVEIDLSLWKLPKYTFFSLSRGLSAYALSLLFSLVWGIWAAKDPVAEKAVIPILDVFQSIPMLGFMPGIVLGLIALFKTTNIGLEIAAILLMFTSQVWNMAFGIYHSIRTVPADKVECARAYGLSGWQLLWWIELPFSTLSLVWNSIMSMAGGWFFLMINEAFILGSRNFQIPGLGSYMSVAAARGDVTAMIWAILSMILLIVGLDQLLWRPLVIWSQKFRIEDTSPTVVSETWFVNILKNSSLRGGSCKTPRQRKIDDFADPLSGSACQSGHLRRDHTREGRRADNATRSGKRAILRVEEFCNWLRGWKFRIGDLRIVSARLAYFVSRTALICLLIILATLAFFVTQFLLQTGVDEWLFLGKMLSFTFFRVFACLSLSVILALPLGLAIGLSETWSRRLEPIIQVGASFPAPLLFPAVILILKTMGIPLGIGSIALMFLGSFWYVFFNVVAGAKAMPSDLREVATNFSLNRMQRFRWLHVPAIFPYLVTGLLTASGGAWNASIVSEYVTYKGAVLTTPGIGSSISLAAQNGNMPLLAASVFVLCTTVVLLNLAVWLRLYHYSEKRFAINY